MNRRDFNVTSPGSLFLFGEHAVLQGQPALVLAIDSRLTLHWCWQDQPEIVWRAGDRRHAFVLGTQAPVPLDPFWRPASHVFTTFFGQFYPHLNPGSGGGFEWDIRSDIPALQGYGSSGALIIAVLTALHEAYGVPFTPQTLLPQALSLVRSLQRGRGSGGDLAASLLGGVVGYQLVSDKPAVWCRENACPGFLWSEFVGYKTPTEVVLSQREPVWSASPVFHRHLFELMGELTLEAHDAIQKADLVRLGEHFNQAQGLLDALGVNDRSLSELIWQWRGRSGILGAKISGSGLGDSVVALSADRIVQEPDFKGRELKGSDRGTEINR